MHILIIPSAYPTKDAPLRSTFFKEQAVALSEAGNKVGVIYSETRRLSKISAKSVKNNHFQITDSIEEGVNTLRLHGWNILMMRNSLGVNLWVKQSLQLFKQYVKKYGKPDIVHVHCALYGGKVGEKIKEKYKIPYVITEHSSLIMNELESDYQKKILKSSYNSADLVISVSSKLKNVIENLVDKPIEVVPNIVNTDAFFYENKREKNKFTFVSVCLLTKNKNVDIAIKAFAEAFRGDEKFEFLVIGDGVEKENLINKAKEEGVDTQVKFVGAVNRKELPTYLQKSDVFILPSKYETFGVAYIEALACGLPIITTKCGGPEDFYNDSLGYMISLEDLDELPEIMKKAYRDINRFDNENISRYVKEKFSGKVIVKELENLYNRVFK